LRANAMALNLGVSAVAGIGAAFGSGIVKHICHACSPCFLLFYDALPASVGLLGFVSF
jgi:hypothetical protein